MKEPYSIKRAAAWAGAGLATSGLTGLFYAVSHHAQNHFETLQESFMHVAAQPEFIIGSLALSAAFGAFMEFKRCYNSSLDKDIAAKMRPGREHKAVQVPKTETPSPKTI